MGIKIIRDWGDADRTVKTASINDVDAVLDKVEKLVSRRENTLIAAMLCYAAFCSGAAYYIGTKVRG